jgi:hypothetical protein
MFCYKKHTYWLPEVAQSRLTAQLTALNCCREKGTSQFRKVIDDLLRIELPQVLLLVIHVVTVGNGRAVNVPIRLILVATSEV